MKDPVLVKIKETATQYKIQNIILFVSSVRG
ncbi:hypothetical protein SAMN05446037_103533 [Anaerovirgula multivorans]|uniref:Uncharacterized protein n=1 Tax=Anaerovirgula multivorans TaxID=312168 RepID=A0A239JFZ2_9FIRM|nr:hypothetical protein SAMN05446037_103533 [Anaerovirgula multivorans]